MTKSYADQCLERASKATPPRWKYTGPESARIVSYQNANSYMFVDVYNPNNGEFTAHARTDVPELARRLKRACEILDECAQVILSETKYAESSFIFAEIKNKIKKLEAPLEENK